MSTTQTENISIDKLLTQVLVDFLEEKLKPEPKAKKKRKTGVYVNGKLVFANDDYDVAEGYARRRMRDFRDSVWLAPVGSFVAP